ncbi:Serine/arginine-rich SC35-like splicing factor SCL28 [Glycine soja]
MGRYRSRSRSYSPRRRSRSPPAPRGRKRYVDDRYGDSRSYRDRRSPLPSGLLVRNLPLDARPEDLRIPFERYGPVKDVYLPKNYYTGEPRGFGFVKYRYGEDAAEAKQHLNHTIIGGREIRIVFAEENRKTPQEMRVNTRGSGRHGGGRRRNRTRSPRPRCQFNYSSLFHFHVPILGLHHQLGMIQGMAGVGMIIILLSDQDLILGLSLPVVGRTTRSPLVSGRMVGVLMTRRIRHPADPRVLGTMIAVLQGLIHGDTFHADLRASRDWKVVNSVFPVTTHCI